MTRITKAPDERRLELLFEAIADGMADADWGDLDLPETIVRFCELFLEAGRADAAFMRSMQRTELSHPGLMDRRVGFERAGLDLMVELIAGRYRSIDDETRLRMRVGWATLATTLREILSPMNPVPLVGLSEQRHLMELAEQFCAYTGLDRRAPRQRRRDDHPGHARTD